MFYPMYLDSLCKRRNWSPPLFKPQKLPEGYQCIVLVNNREYSSGDALQSEELAVEAASMRAYLMLRNFSVNDSMYPGKMRAGGVRQESPIVAIGTGRHRNDGPGLSYDNIPSRASDVSSICSFQTALSQTGSRVPVNLERTRTAWEEVLHEKNLITEKEDELNWSERGQHVEFGPDEQSTVDKLLESAEFLGHSATAIVDKVRCKRILLARKKIRCTWRLKREAAIEEVAHLQRLRHSHVVRGVGTYTLGKTLGILLYPATDYNLETFLEYCVDLESALKAGEQLVTLHTTLKDLCGFFQCLTNTIVFVHEHLIKHMDIKPTNILVQEKRWVAGSKQYKVYLADFGTARSYKDAAEVDTENPTAYTKAYAAPEVISQEERGFGADIFSLGCVFLEILAVLCTPMQRYALGETRKKNPGGDFSYQANMQAILESELFSEKHFSDERGKMWFETITQMVNRDSTTRPSAIELQSTFGTGQDCCFMGPEPFEAADHVVMEAKGGDGGG